MASSGIPERYKNMGFTHVGQKMKGDGKHKWKVLAKKGDQYKVVQGGWRGMEDFSQHHSEKRKERFWDRMGGRNSSKAKDPFSPLYWHKRLGTWEEGGEAEMEAPEPVPGYRRRGIGRFIKPISKWTGKNDPWYENVFEIIDPTGISSWDDAAEKIRQIGDRKQQGWRKYVNTAGAVLQALPKTRWLAGIDPVTDPEAWEKFPKVLKAMNQLRLGVGTMIPLVQNTDKYLNPGNKLLAPYKEGGIYIDPSKRGTFKAQATRMGMGVQEAAAHILANKEDYSPAMVKKANFARNFAKEYGGVINNEDIVNEGLIDSYNMNNYRKGGSTWSGNAWYQDGGPYDKYWKPLDQAPQIGPIPGINPMPNGGWRPFGQYPSPIPSDSELADILRKDPIVDERMPRKRRTKTKSKDFDVEVLIPYNMGGNMPCYNCGGMYNSGQLDKAQNGKQVPPGKAYYVAHGYPEDAYSYDGNSHYVKGIAQVERPEGMRFYEDYYKSGDKYTASEMAKQLALRKALYNPADSMRTNGVYPRIMATPNFNYGGFYKNGGSLPTYQSEGQVKEDTLSEIEALARLLYEKNKNNAWKQNLSANDTGSYANSNIGYKAGSKNATNASPASPAGVSYIDSLAAAKAVADSLKAKNSADSLAAIQAADSLAANSIVANNNPDLDSEVQNVTDSEDRSNVTRNILYGTGLAGMYGAQRVYRGARNEYRNTKAIKDILDKIYVNQNGVYTVDDVVKLKEYNAPTEVVEHLKKTAKLYNEQLGTDQFKPHGMPEYAKVKNPVTGKRYTAAEVADLEDIYRHGVQKRSMGLSDDALKFYESLKGGLSFKMSQLAKEYPWIRRMLLLKKQMGGDLYDPIGMYAQNDMYNPAAMYGGQPTYKHGGYTVGDEVDVTPEELEKLRAQGYTFENI